MVHAGISELRTALHRHSTTNPLQRQSGSLLLFYAAECGLKAAWIRRNNLRNTSQFDASAQPNPRHDLILLVKNLKLPAAMANAKAGFRLKRDGTAVDTAALHEAWRYGVEVLPLDETIVVTWLQALCQWAKGELTR